MVAVVVPVRLYLLHPLVSSMTIFQPPHLADVVSVSQLSIIEYITSLSSLCGTSNDVMATSQKICSTLITMTEPEVGGAPGISFDLKLSRQPARLSPLGPEYVNVFWQPVVKARSSIAAWPRLRSNGILLSWSGDQHTGLASRWCWRTRCLNCWHNRAAKIEGLRWHGILV